MQVAVLRVMPPGAHRPAQCEAQSRCEPGFLCSGSICTSKISVANASTGEFQVHPNFKSNSSAEAPMSPSTPGKFDSWCTRTQWNILVETRCNKHPPQAFTWDVVSKSNHTFVRMLRRRDVRYVLCCITVKAIGRCEAELKQRHHIVSQGD